MMDNVTMTNPKADWYRVRRATRLTCGKEDCAEGVPVSDKFKREMLLAEHSPIRLLEYDITLSDIQQWITTHLVRHHIGVEKFVCSQRVDRNEQVKELSEKMMSAMKECGVEYNSLRDCVPQGLKGTMMISANAQAIINISRKRLCSCASEETRKVWKNVIMYLSTIDPILAEKCVPECVYRGFCPERDSVSCHYDKTKQFNDDLIKYRRRE